jgi:hypothetical protein
MVAPKDPTWVRIRHIVQHVVCNLTSLDGAVPGLLGRSRARHVGIDRKQVWPCTHPQASTSQRCGFHWKLDFKPALSLYQLAALAAKSCLVSWENIGIQVKENNSL